MRSRIIGLASVLIAFFSGYFLGLEQNHLPPMTLEKISPTPTLDSKATLTDKTRDLIDRFERAQMKRDNLRVLGLMSPSGSSEEKDKLVFVAGLDLPLASPRLYATAGFNYLLKSYKILSVKEVNGFNSIAEVEEVRKVYDNTSIEWHEQAPKIKIVETESFGPFKLFVKNYYDKGATPSKYHGFYSY